jgi:hypothetical protein
MAGGKKFDPDRFEELVHYIAWKTRNNPEFGRVRMAKVLYYVDFSHFAEGGESFTGARYVAEQFGPFPSYLTTAEEHLVDQGLVQSDRLERGEREDGMENRIIAASAPEVRFDGYVQVVVDQWIKTVSSVRSAKRLSDLTHEAPGWILARPRKEEIPYESVFIGTKAPTDKAVARGRELVGEFQWE